jgi:hypothetical protein
VVVYQRTGVRAVVAVLSALLLAYCYRVAVALVAVALLVALALAWWPWPCMRGRWWWPAAGLLLVRAVRVVAGGLASGRMRPVESTIYC